MKITYQVCLFKCFKQKGMPYLFFVFISISIIRKIKLLPYVCYLKRERDILNNALHVEVLQVTLIYIIGCELCGEAEESNGS